MLWIANIYIMYIDLINVNRIIHINNSQENLINILYEHRIR